MQGIQNLGHLHPRWKSALDEVIVNLHLLFAAEQNSISGGKRTASPAHLLVVSNHRAGSLVVNHKGEIGFVKTHAQRGGRHQNLHAVLQQRIFQFHSTFASLSAVRLRLNALRLKPTCHLHRVAHGERVNDAAALDIRQVGCQPTHPFGLTRDADGLKQERRSS